MDIKEFQKLSHTKQLGMAHEAQYIASLIKAQNFDPYKDYGWASKIPVSFRESVIRNVCLLAPAASVNPKYLVKKV